MSVSRTIVVYCDACIRRPPCRTGPVLTVAEVRSEAKGRGWHHINPARDICPECWKEGRR